MYNNIADIPTILSPVPYISASREVGTIPWIEQKSAQQIYFNKSGVTPNAIQIVSPANNSVNFNQTRITSSLNNIDASDGGATFPLTLITGVQDRYQLSYTATTQTEYIATNEMNNASTNSDDKSNSITIKVKRDAGMPLIGDTSISKYTKYS